MLIHDPDLLDGLERFQPLQFSGVVFRATRMHLDPLADSRRGGRWAPPDLVPVLYTSLERDGALAEIAYHWSQLTPPPTKPANVHRLEVATEQQLHLLRGDLEELGVDEAVYRSVNYARTQEIGAAVAWLGYDGLQVPSARWDCENLVLFTENRHDGRLDLVASEELDWQAWARDHGFLD